ncbi:hypothetical protein A5802_001299, partial [Enterococcus mundtii]
MHFLLQSFSYKLKGNKHFDYTLFSLLFFDNIKKRRFKVIIVLN